MDGCTELMNSGQNSGIMAREIHGGINYNYSKNYRPSLIEALIKELVNITDGIEFDELSNFIISKDDTKVYKIQNKIVHNNVKEYIYLIEDYYEYREVCERALNIIDDNNFGSKKKLLKNISKIYKKIKYRLIAEKQQQEDIEVIRENSDDIISEISTILTDRVREGEMGQLFFEEDISDGIDIFLCYAFVECKILERPVE